MTSPRELWRSLTQDETEARETQLRALKALSVTLEQAGPPRWFDWMRAARNASTHREHRSEIITTERSKREGWQTFRLMASNPGQSNLEALRTAQHRLGNLHLHEDARDTLGGLATTLSASVAASLTDLAAVWRLRREQPGLVVQPARQWDDEDGQRPFVGFAPDTATIGKNVQMHASPVDVHRLRAGGLLRPGPGSVTSEV